MLAIDSIRGLGWNELWHELLNKNADDIRKKALVTDWPTGLRGSE